MSAGLATVRGMRTKYLNGFVKKRYSEQNCGLDILSCNSDKILDSVRTTQRRHSYLH